MNGSNKKPVWRDGQGEAFVGTGRQLDYTLVNYLRQLPIGERASMANLAARRGVSEREIRKRVECLRRAGIPVMSSTVRGESGYWLAREHEEAESGATRIIRQAWRKVELARRMMQPELPFDGGEDERW